MTKRLLLPVLVVALLGCGHRALPLPPLRKTPPAPTGFRLAQRGSALEVMAQAPAASVDGVAYEAVALEFLYTEGEKDLEKAGARRTVSTAAGRTVIEELPLPAPGTLMRAAARAVAGGETGPRSLTLALVAQAPLDPPRELSATLGEKAVSLAWSGARPKAVPPPVFAPKAAALAGRSVTPAPSTTAKPASEPGAKADAGEAALGGFFVYRRRGPRGSANVGLPGAGHAAYGTPLVEEPLEDPRFDDLKAPLGATVCYVVRAVGSPDPLIESAPSNEACVDVRDITAPATPAGLAVLPREGGLEILWSPSVEDDLAGYRVYRAGPGGEKEKLAEVAASRSNWLDTTARSGVTYRYSISATDQAGNESPPGASVEATPP